MKNLSKLLLFTLLFAAIPALQAQPQNYIEDGDFAKKDEFWKLQAHGQQTMTPEWVAGPQEGSTALRVTVDPNEKMKKYSVGLSQSLKIAVKPAEKLTLRFMARSPQGNSIAAMIQQPQPPHRRAFYREFKLTPEWKAYEATGSNAEGFVVGDGKIEFFLSLAPGQIELTNVYIAGAE